MSVFCLLWVPLFYLFRRSLMSDSGAGGVWAVILGSLTAILQFFLGYSISPGGFGFSRWLFGFVDLVSLPVLIPFAVYLVLFLFRGFSGGADFANFALLWLIPVAALRAIGWGATNDTILLVAVPLLWTALAVGIPFFINLLSNNFNALTALVSILCILILPILAAAVYWAFFSQHILIGFILMFVINIPVVISFFAEA
jgi:hypothetical protein